MEKSPYKAQIFATDSCEFTIDIEESKEPV